MIRPYKRPPKPSVLAFLDARGRVHDEYGSTSRAPGKGLVTYGLRDVGVALAAKGHGELVCWNDVPVRWENEGRSVILLTPGLDVPGWEEAMVRVRDWAADAGARMGSLGGTARSLARATIARTVRFETGDWPGLGEVVGGRIQAGMPPGRYPGVDIWDLAAAYASALGTVPWGGRWTAWEPFRGFPEGVPVFVLAEVRYQAPGPSWGPLPVRRRRAPRSYAARVMFEHRSYPTKGKLTGIWALPELRLAEEAGAKVTYRAAWIAPSEEVPFDPWWSYIQAGRRMRGTAGTIAKMIGNAMVGTLATNGTRSRKRMGPQGWETTPENLPKRPAGAGSDLFEWITAGVRTRLYTDLIAPNPERVIAVHTDGGLLWNTSTLKTQPPQSRENGNIESSDASSTNVPFAEPTSAPSPRGLMRDQRTHWRRKERGVFLTFLEPWCYAYAGPKGTVYKVSGVPAHQAARTFWTLASIRLRQEGQPTATLRAKAIKAILATFSTLSPTEAAIEADRWTPGPMTPTALAELKELLGVDHPR